MAGVFDSDTNFFHDSPIFWERNTLSKEKVNDDLNFSLGNYEIRIGRRRIALVLLRIFRKRHLFEMGKDWVVEWVLYSPVHALIPMFLASSLVDIGMTYRNLCFNAWFTVGEVSGCSTYVTFGRYLDFLGCDSF